jgi:hypothetical protein
MFIPSHMAQPLHYPLYRVSSQLMIIICQRDNDLSRHWWDNSDSFPHAPAALFHTVPHFPANGNGLKPESVRSASDIVRNVCRAKVVQMTEAH